VPQLNIRPECLKPADAGWQQPTSDEIREVLRASGLTGSEASRRLGLGDKGDRSVRRWIGGESAIPYAVWALLCDLAGQGQIWKK
jgi:hypothetical protein